MLLSLYSKYQGVKYMHDELIKQAKNAQQYAYVPYSNFQVGAAVKMASGNVYTGSNIENASYSLTCCAERTAIFKAVSEGETTFLALAVIGNTKKPISPCGACRQVMTEFFTNETKIFLSNAQGDVYESSITELLPFHFTL